MQVVGGADHGPLSAYVVESIDGESSKSKVLLDEGEHGFDEVPSFLQVVLDLFVILSGALALDDFVVLG